MRPADLLDQLLVHRIGLAEDLALVAGAVEILEQHNGVGRVARAEDRVRLHAGCVIGSDGFGYAPRKQGAEVVANTPEEYDQFNRTAHAIQAP